MFHSIMNHPVPVPLKFSDFIVQMRTGRSPDFRHITNDISGLDFLIKPKRRYVIDMAVSRLVDLAVRALASHNDDIPEPGSRAGIMDGALRGRVYRRAVRRSDIYARMIF